MQELEKEQCIEHLHSEVETLDAQQRDSQDQVAKCESVIEQLTQELASVQEALSSANARIKDCNNDISQLKEQLQDFQHEVRINMFQHLHIFMLCSNKFFWIHL